MRIGNRIYYDIRTGIIIQETGETDNEWAKPQSPDDEIKTYLNLSSRDRKTFDYIDIRYGDYQLDFHLSKGNYRVNPETKTLEFHYPSDNEIPEVPVYQKPITEELEELRLRVLTPSEQYIKLDKESVTLEELKQYKIAQLSQLCTETIHKGFFTEYGWFGLKQHDQDNMTQQMVLIVAGNTKDFDWKTMDNGVVKVTVPQFLTIINKASEHKRFFQEIYWEKEKQVMESKTKEEVDSVNWSE